MAALLGICGVAVIFVGVVVALASHSPYAWTCLASGLLSAVLFAAANHIDSLNNSGE